MELPRLLKSDKLEVDYSIDEPVLGRALLDVGFPEESDLSASIIYAVPYESGNNYGVTVPVEGILTRTAMNRRQKLRNFVLTAAFHVIDGEDYRHGQLRDDLVKFGVADEVARNTAELKTVSIVRVVQRDEDRPLGSVLNLKDPQSAKALSLPDTNAMILAHEIRHMWQFDHPDKIARNLHGIQAEQDARTYVASKIGMQASNPWLGVVQLKA
jgi:hypothetical protein